jgi:hypothetical protein
MSYEYGCKFFHIYHADIWLEINKWIHEKKNEGIEIINIETVTQNIDEVGYKIFYRVTGPH